MKTLFIINPAAGRGGAPGLWKRLRDYISIPYDFVTSQGPGDASLLAKEGVEEGFDKIVPVGGDGTVHEVVNGIVGAPVKLGVIPAGSGNDFVRTLGIPSDPKLALRYIEEGKANYMDLGRFNGGYYINSAGIGLDAEIVRTACQDMKFIPGPISYTMAVFVSLMRFSPWKTTIKIDGNILERKVWLVAVLNGKYIGGGMMMAPDATLDSGLLEVCIVNEMSRSEIVKFLPKIFRGGHRDHPGFELYRGKDISIKTSSQLPFHVDGEVIGRAPVSFSVAPKAIKVIGYRS